jgi:hypothetical protein
MNEKKMKKTHPNRSPFFSFSSCIYIYIYLYDFHIRPFFLNKMETSALKSSTATTDQVIPETIQEGFEKIIAQGAMGFVLGGMAGIVLARGGGSSSARRVLAGFGAGVGSGSAWTRTSMDINDFLTTLTGKKE